VISTGGQTNCCRQRRGALLGPLFQIATPGEDPKYDAIVENMDLIWSGPWAKGHGLFPTEISEKALNEHKNKN
jgi:hypothetical protein